MYPIDDLLFILSTVMCFGDTSTYHKQPFGPKMCEELRQLWNCSSVLFIVDHLSCQVFEERNKSGTCLKTIKDLNTTLSNSRARDSKVYYHRHGEHQPKGYKKFADGDETLQIKLYSERKKWDDALRACQKDGGSLVKISNKNKDMFVRSHFGYSIINQHVWIGLMDLYDNDTFFWADGTPVNFTNWAPGEPYHVHKKGNEFIKENCVELVIKLTKWEWNDCSCEGQMAFICDM